MIWKLAEAKNRLSEVVRRALQEGPQRIERRHDAVVVIAADEFDRLIGKKVSFQDYISDVPGFEELTLERDATGMREFEFDDE